VNSKEYPLLSDDKAAKKIIQADLERQVEQAKNLWGHSSRFKADFPHEIIELDNI